MHIQVLIYIKIPDSLFRYLLSTGWIRTTSKTIDYQSVSIGNREIVLRDVIYSKHFSNYVQVTLNKTSVREDDR